MLFLTLFFPSCLSTGAEAEQNIGGQHREAIANKTDVSSADSIGFLRFHPLPLFALELCFHPPLVL